MKTDVNKSKVIVGSPISDKQSTGNKSDGKPNADKLEHVFNKLSETLPRLFTHTMDYTIYHPDMIFENNIRGTRTV